MCLSFNVTPSEFAPKDGVALYTRAVCPLDGKPLQNVSTTFLQNGISFIDPSQYLQTGSNGVASVIWLYTSDGSIGSICTVNASVKSDTTIGNRTLAVQPLTLTVGSETSLLLEAWRDPQGTGHTIYARLVDASGSGLSGYTVTLTVNGTAYTQQTNNTGYVTLHLALQPGDTSANTYQVMATFNGTNPKSANTTASDPYGDQYAVCTTTQYDLRPSTNSSTLSVLLQSSDAITAAKTAEQMQQKAKDKGWLNVYDEWSWWYPWYRLHIKLTLSNTTIDVGFSPFLPFGTTLSMVGVESLASVLPYVTEEIWQDTAMDFAGLFVSYVAAKALSVCGEVPGLIAIGAKGLVQWALFLPLLVNEKAGSVRMLAACFANILMGLIALATDVGETFAKALWNVCTAPILSALMLGTDGMIKLASPLELLRTGVDYIESFVIDFPMALVAWARYSGWI
jgi:hypothetical protein